MILIFIDHFDHIDSTSLNVTWEKYFLYVSRSDIVPISRVVLVSFAAQLKSIMSYDFGVLAAC